MKTFTETLTLTTTYPLSALGAYKDLLFVDIETTGFSAKSATLYEIGCVYFENETPILKQFFAENKSEEKDILAAFFALCESHGILIHFNGNTFDLPFMKTKAKLLDLECPFDKLDGVDLFKRIFPYKSMLGLENCKQKTIEQFLNIARKDTMSGGELIAVYEDYVKEPSDEALELLILHNKDDMKGMLKLLPILSYSDIFTQPFRVTKVQANHYAELNGQEKDEILMKLRFHTEFPKAISFSKAECSFQAEGNEGYLKVPLYNEEMKYFYANYKDYYYLPLEDLALHKSVASFVEKDHRKQAKASNCYTRKISSYLPEWDLIFEPFFKRNYEDKQFFFELTEDMKKQPEIFRTYALHILDMMIYSK